MLPLTFGMEMFPHLWDQEVNFLPTFHAIHPVYVVEDFLLFVYICIDVRYPVIKRRWFP